MLLLVCVRQAGTSRRHQPPAGAPLWVRRMAPVVPVPGPTVSLRGLASRLCAPGPAPRAVPQRLLEDAAVLAVDAGGGAAHAAGDLAAGAEQWLEEPVDELIVGVLGARDGQVDGGRHGIAGLPDRGGDRAEPGDGLVPLDQVAVLPSQLELRAQRVDGRDRLRTPGAAE